jgi:hypothetical protein
MTVPSAASYLFLNLWVRWCLVYRRSDVADSGQTAVYKQSQRKQSFLISVSNKELMANSEHQSHTNLALPGKSVKVEGAKMCFSECVFMFMSEVKRLLAATSPNNSAVSSKSCCTWVSIVTRLRAGRLGFDSRKGLEFFSSPPLSDRLWGPPSFLSSGYQRLFRRGYSGRGVKLTTHLHLVPRLRMRRAIHPHPQYVFIVWCLVLS